MTYREHDPRPSARTRRHEHRSARRAARVALATLDYSEWDDATGSWEVMA